MDDNTEAYRRAKARVETLRDFYIHLAVYIAVNIFLFIINMLTSRDSLWFYWPLLGWGIGLAVHAIYVFGVGGRLSRDWEERKVREFMAEEERRQRQRGA
jgi:hypothetical protein